MAKNTASSLTGNRDCVGSLTSGGYNLLGTSSSAGCPRAASDLAPQDPKLIVGSGNAPVWAGGAGAVYVPQTGSPLFNAIPSSNAICKNATRDQRGVKRGKFGGCEPGAVERSSALFVVDNPAALNAGDAATKAMIEDLGFAVALADDDTVNVATASGIHLIAISESVTSAKIGTKLRTIDSDVLVLEPSLFDDMNMTGLTENTHYGHLDGQQVIRLRSGSSVRRVLGMTGNFTASLFTTTSNQTFGWGVPGASATIHAITNEAVTTHATFFDYPMGFAMFDGTSAPARRVGFYAFPGVVPVLTGDSNNLDGKGLMRQAIVLASADWLQASK